MTCCRSSPKGVYPRTGGETEVSDVRSAIEAGLSPHGRGNQAYEDKRAAGWRSIPARAGKPTCVICYSSCCWVYPRTGGETFRSSCCCPTRRGLSPHGRGNHHHLPAGDVVAGSIPARAGKPLKPAWSSITTGVYPRTGGETAHVLDRHVTGRGLSPHGRGNLFHDILRLTLGGSIPARAGKP